MAVGWWATCAKALLIIFNLIFWLTGVCLLIFGIWMVVDPQRSYLLDLVNFSEQDPLLKIAAYIFIAVGCAIIVVGFLGCCGALQEVQCMLITYVIFLVLIIGAELSAGILAVIFKDRFTSSYMQEYMYNKTIHLYGRRKWVDNLVDTVQYYQKCCGSYGPEDYEQSYWQIYKSRGTVLYVPKSCCKQTQEARPPDRLQPINPRCQVYQYDTEKFKSAAYSEGCHEKLLEWFNQHAIMFIIVAMSVALFQVFGIVFSICLCRNTGYEI